MRLEKDKAHVSMIFKWFADDFKGGDVPGWLADHIPEVPPTLSYMKYDWSLNKVE